MPEFRHEPAMVHGGDWQNHQIEQHTTTLDAFMENGANQ
jgi:hypothetical protein